MDSQEQTTVELKKKEIPPERLAQLQKARELALHTRREKAEVKAKEKALAKAELEAKKKDLDNRMMALNTAEPPKKKEKKIVYVEPSSSSSGESEEEVEYVKRPKAPKAPRPVEDYISRETMRDQLQRLKREHMMAQMFGGRAY